MNKVKIKRPVSTLTHTTREVALDFLRWRESRKEKFFNWAQWWP